MQRVHLAERGFVNSHIAMLGSFSQRFAQRRHRTRWRVGRRTGEAWRESESEEEEEKEGEQGDERQIEEGCGGGGGAGAAATTASQRGWRLERAILMAARIKQGTKARFIRRRPLCGSLLVPTNHMLAFAYHCQQYKS